MRTFFDILRLGVFPLALAALYGLGEYRKTLAKYSPCPESERLRVWSKAVFAFLFWFGLAAPFAFCLNGMAQSVLISEFGGELADCVRDFLSAAKTAKFWTFAIYAVFVAAPAYFPAYLAYRRALHPLLYEWEKFWANLPPTSPRFDRFARVASAVLSGVVMFCVAYPICFVVFFPALFGIWTFFGLV